MNLIIAVTGSIAAYKALVVSRALTKRGVAVRAVLTENATKFITPLSFESLTDEPAYTTLFPEPNPSPTPLHLELAEWADALLVAPASANFLSKASSGVADDLLSTLFVAFQGPVLVAPAMHDNMWASKAVQENVKILSRRGVGFIGPEEGDLATGRGNGRLSEPREIIDRVMNLLGNTGSLRGKRLVVAYGRTEEDLDDVRVITNRSSGKLGRVLCERATHLGAEVEAVIGPGAELPANTQAVHRIRTSSELDSALRKRVPGCDVFVMAAAVSDFRPKRRKRGKTKRKGTLEILLSPTDDILAGLSSKKKRKQIFVGFALESSRLLQNAKAKLERKNVDMIVANSLEAMDSETIRGYILSRNEPDIRFGPMSKREFADLLLERLSNALG
jgi:phosphopantothenoylcysteine decarboxylase/phosphopantothenate--cysteine ligase